MISLFSMKPNALLKDEINNDVHFLFAKTKDIYIYQIFLRKILETQFGSVGTRFL